MALKPVCGRKKTPPEVRFISDYRNAQVKDKDERGENTENIP